MANDISIIGASINWNLEYGNHPELVVEVSDLPEEGTYRAYEIGDSTLYVSEVGGFARYMVHNPRNQRGFGGVEFKLEMEDGSIRTVKGPWSSRCSVVNVVCPNHYMEVALIHEGGRYHGNLRVEVVAELVKQLGAFLFRLRDKFGDGEIGYEISSRNDGFWKPGWSEEYMNKGIIGSIPPELV